MKDTFRIALEAKMKNGVLYEAIKSRGWNNRQAAEFLGLSQGKFGAMLNLKQRPPYLFSKTRDRNHDKKRQRLEEKLMELTGKTIDEIFPEEFQTDEFLSRKKTLVAVKDVPRQVLLESTGMDKLLPAPDMDLIKKEAVEELAILIDQLPEEQRHAIHGLYIKGKSPQELASERGVGVPAINSSLKKAEAAIREKVNIRHSLEKSMPWLESLSLMKKRIR